MKNKIALESLSMDLMRVAIGYHRNSDKMAERFFMEALKRKQEIDLKTVSPYVKILLNKFKNIRLQKEKQKIAEDALLYSVLFKNAALKST